MNRYSPLMVMLIRPNLAKYEIDRTRVKPRREFATRFHGYDYGKTRLVPMM